jgi:lysophospholipase L1-like esterase
LTVFNQTSPNGTWQLFVIDDAGQDSGAIDNGWALTISTPETNQSPTANAGADQTVTAGASVQLNGTGSVDPDGTITGYAWTQIAPASPTVTLSNANTATAGFTAPAVSVATVFTFQLSVTDNQGATGFDEVIVTVQPSGPPNQPPVANPQSVTTPEDSPKSITLTGSDPDGNPITFAVASGPTHGGLSGTPPNLLYTPSLNYNGSDSFTFTVSDASLTSAPATISITVTPVNDAPTANAGPDQTVNQGVAVQLNGTASSDSESSPLTYQWTQTAGPTVTLSNANTATAGFTAPAVSVATVFTFQLSVTDNQGATGFDTVNVTVQPSGPPNQPPVANNACVSTPVNTSVTGQLSATDPEGQSLMYSLVTQADKGSVNLDISGNFAYTPNSPDFRGLDKFTYSVTDTEGLTSTGSVWVLIDGAVRIMPLGDSITFGVYTISSPPDGEAIGYRKKLYESLEAISPAYAVNFVGGSSNGSSASPPIVDPDHEGHPGFCAGPNGNNPTVCTGTNGDKNLADNVIAWLNANPADVILLHIGTNAFTTNESDVQLLLDRIETWQASHYPITVFVARIVQDVNAPFLDVQTFNDNVTTMIGGRTNVRYILVNQQTGASLNYSIGAPDGSPTGPDMADDLHPNQDGYEKMAAKWLSELTNPVNVGPKFIGLPQCP